MHLFSKSTYAYGDLGQMADLTRTIRRHSESNQPVSYRSASFKYQSNYLGQLNAITYPDGEVLSYGYDDAGQVNSVYGTRYGQRFDYVNNITYDQFGQRSYIQYGNGVETTYNYDEQLRYLDSLQTASGSTTLQDLNYSFDKVGNITAITNVTAGRNVSQEYSYDDLYQLTGASGKYQQTSSSKRDTNLYSQSFTYDDLGNMTSKISSQHTW
jgi:YD repeat-containing protein